MTADTNHCTCHQAPRTEDRAGHVAARPPAAAEEWLERLYHRIEQVVERDRLIHAEDRGDVAHDAFLVALDRLVSIAPHILLENVATIVRDVRVVYFRRAQCAARYRILARGLDRFEHDAGHSPVEHEELCDRVRAALGRLTDRERSIVWAVLIEGCSQKAVSLRLNISEAYVAILLQRACEKMAPLLRDYI